MNIKFYLKTHLMPSAKVFAKLLLCIVMTTNVSIDYSSEVDNGIEKVSYKIVLNT